MWGFLDSRLRGNDGKGCGTDSVVRDGQHGAGMTVKGAGMTVSVGGLTRPTPRQLCESEQLLAVGKPIRSAAVLQLHPGHKENVITVPLQTKFCELRRHRQMLSDSE